jgi:hypothetical protein
MWRRARRSGLWSVLSAILLPDFVIIMHADSRDQGDPAMLTTVLIGVCLICALDLVRLHRSTRSAAAAPGAPAPSRAAVPRRLAFYMLAVAIIYYMGGWLSYLTP